jgi:hypothetical protein
MNTILRAARAIPIVSLVIVAGCGRPIADPSNQGPARNQDVLSRGSGTPEKAGYAEDWRVDSLTAAAESATFDIIEPSEGPLSEQTVQGVYVYPGGVAVAIDYAPPKEPERYVRQEYIEIYQTAWTHGQKPIDAYAADIQASADPNKSLTEIGGVPVVMVAPHSKADIEEANPAFVKFVVDGVEIQISGGEDVDLLLSMASAMIESR